MQWQICEVILGDFETAKRDLLMGDAGRSWLSLCGLDDFRRATRQLTVAEGEADWALDVLWSGTFWFDISICII